MDPRGTGLSTPLPCPLVQPKIADPRDTSGKTRRAVHAALKRYVQGCVRRQGRFLPHITTANTVHDIDLARRLARLGVVDWFGVSGGTWMGAWYAQLHPKSLGRVVLDANAQFTTDWRTSFSDFPKGFHLRYTRQFLPWAARHHATYRLGSTPEAVAASYEQLRRYAAAGKVVGMTPGDADAVLSRMLYDDGNFAVLAQFISQIVTEVKAKGRANPQAPPEEPEDSSQMTVRTSVICNDTPYERTPASIEGQILADIRRDPVFGSSLTWVLGPCAYWPYQPKPAPKIDGTGAPTLLMVQSEFDPATPLSGARRAQAAFRGARMLLVENTGTHGAYVAPLPCVDRIVTGYLTKGTLPEGPLTCAGLPLAQDKKVFEVSPD